MSKSILVIEGDHADIIHLRKLVNKTYPTRNMVWHEDREMRFNGGTTFVAFSEILNLVMQQTGETLRG